MYLWCEDVWEVVTFDGVTSLCVGVGVVYGRHDVCIQVGLIFNVFWARPS